MLWNIFCPAWQFAKKHAQATHLVSGSVAVCIIVIHVVPGQGGRSKGKGQGGLSCATNPVLERVCPGSCKEEKKSATWLGTKIS